MTESSTARYYYANHMVCFIALCVCIHTHTTLPRIILYFLYELSSIIVLSQRVFELLNTDNLLNDISKLLIVLNDVVVFDVMIPQGTLLDTKTLSKINLNYPKLIRNVFKLRGHL